MPAYDYILCDVFTTRPFGGNPLAVFPDARGIDDATMQRIAGELNLSETVFVLPPDDERALRRLRIFTPGRELPLAGHPVVGAWFVLASEGVVAAPEGGKGMVRIHQQLAVGVLPVDIEFANGAPVSVVMSQPAPAIGEPIDAQDEAAAALGLGPADIATPLLVPIVTISAGSPFLAVPLASRAALARCRPVLPALDPLLDVYDAHGVYAYYRESPALVHARMFGGSRLGITEDPATGGAAGPLAGALVEYKLLPPESPRFTIEQGADMGRTSTIGVEAVFERETLSAVRVSGPAVIVARGRLSW